jgi:hypothetical protein
LPIQTTAAGPAGVVVWLGGVVEGGAADGGTVVVVVVGRDVVVSIGPDAVVGVVGTRGSVLVGAAGVVGDGPSDEVVVALVDGAVAGCGMVVADVSVAPGSIESDATGAIDWSECAQPSIAVSPAAATRVHPGERHRCCGRDALARASGGSDIHPPNSGSPAANFPLRAQQDNGHWSRNRLLAATAGVRQHRVVGGGGQFGLLEVEDLGTTMRVRLTGRNWINEILLSYEFQVDA